MTGALATVDAQHLACDERGVFQKQDRVDDVLNLSLTSDWMQLRLLAKSSTANSSIGSLKPRTGYSPTRSRSKSLSTKSVNAGGQQHRSAQLLGEGFETRSHVDRRTDDGEVEPGARPDIAVHDVSDVDADAVIQRRTTGFAVLFVQANHGLTGLSHGQQQICVGRPLAERGQSAPAT